MKNLEPLLNPEERMTDDELSEHAEQFHNDLALLQHQQRQAVDPDAVSAEICEMCDNEIPEARRKQLPGVTLCVECKTAEEQRDKRYGRDY